MLLINFVYIGSLVSISLSRILHNLLLGYNHLCDFVLQFLLPQLADSDSKKKTKSERHNKVFIFKRNNAI